MKNKSPGRTGAFSLVVRWSATVAFASLHIVWIASIWVEASIARGFARDPQHAQYWAWVHGGVVIAGENLVPGGGMTVTNDIFVDVPVVRWNFSYRNNRSYRDVGIPLWAPTLLAGMTAAWCWRRERQRRRLAIAGSCPSCGYSRAGLAADAKCPECGTA